MAWLVRCFRERLVDILPGGLVSSKQVDSIVVSRTETVGDEDTIRVKMVVQVLYDSSTNIYKNTSALHSFLFY